MPCWSTLQAKLVDSFFRYFYFKSDHVCHSVQNWHGPTSMYFVGHSLGGGISQIAAATLHEKNEELGLKSHVQSYGVCSPGTLLSSAKFGFSVESLDLTSTSLLPRRDLVSMVDQHGGSVQYTECSAEDMSACHYWKNVMCELFYGCPAELGQYANNGLTHKALKHYCNGVKNEEDGTAVGKSIMAVSGRNITLIEEWTDENITAKCDAPVYEFCNATNVQLEIGCQNNASFLTTLDDEDEDEDDVDIHWEWDLCDSDIDWDWEID